MKTPEMLGQKQTVEYKTAIPDVTFRDIDAAALPDLKQLFESNASYIARGGIIPDYVYDITEQEVLGDNPNGHQRMGIWKNEQLVGYVAVLPAENAKNKNSVEISYVVDPAHARQGIARAVVEAVTNREIEKGHGVIAEVEPYNQTSIRLLGKLGFELAGRSDGRNVYAHTALSEEEMLRRLGF